MATIKATVIENSGFVLLGRLAGIDGQPLVQADIDAIEVRSYIHSGQQKGTLVIPTGAPEPYTGTDLDPVDVLFDELQTDDPRWTEDEEGYNFLYVVDGSFVPEGDITYQVEVKVTPVSGPSTIGLWQLKATNVYTQ